MSICAIELERGGQGKMQGQLIGTSFLVDARRCKRDIQNTRNISFVTNTLYESNNEILFGRNGKSISGEDSLRVHCSFDLLQLREVLRTIQPGAPLLDAQLRVHIVNKASERR